ncbi:ParB/RepB/Spo0J family partition protein [Ideonella sp.]|uniref:ParB/RepB/Spo0J family partition protein n=1 Tax=Ideonella sp. TaxID=1929293 RepID=UPI003BB74251
MSKKLAAKAGLIQAPALMPAPPQRTEAPDMGRPKTAPGSMLQFMSSQSAAIKEADDLRERLREFDGAAPVRALDPTLVLPSKWANRHEASFASDDFAALRDEIDSAGGNVQPIRVRPLASDSGPLRYELVYGHRRHRACLDLGIPVKALVEDASDQELFEAMERENRGRKNLSAWEQGCMYRKALDEGLYPSLRKLAEAVKVDVSLVSKSVALARLPDAVIQAFPTPLEIQFRWAQPLSEALQRDPEGVVARARALREAREPVSAAQAFDRLIQVPSANPIPEPVVRVFQRKGKEAGRWSSDAKGRLLIRLEPGLVNDGQRKELMQLIERFLAE